MMQYVERAKILEEQDEFARNVFWSIISYRCIIVAALLAGGQKYVHPFFAQSDQRHSSTCIAVT
jgi:hypothetical protein